MRDLPHAHGRAVRVRLGLQRGEPVITDEGYVRVDVQRMAVSEGRAMGLDRGVEYALRRSSRR